MFGSQPLPPPGGGYLILRPDGAIDLAVSGIPAAEVTAAVAGLRRRRGAGWVAGYWRTPRGQIWLQPEPLVAIGSADYEAAGRALLYRCGVGV